MNNIKYKVCKLYFKKSDLNCVNKHTEERPEIYQNGNDG